jgi:short-subunit dehydrogenase
MARSTNALRIAFVAAAAYCASKHAVVAISECLHLDLTFGAGAVVKVSVLCPSWVKTRIADSARNRPPSPSHPSPVEGDPRDQMLQSMIRSSIEGGMDPDEVAGQVVDAIRAERFWVLTHPDSDKAVERRTRGIVGGGTPEFDFSEP